MSLLISIAYALAGQAVVQDIAEGDQWDMLGRGEFHHNYNRMALLCYKK